MEGIIKISALCAACLLFVAPLPEFEEVRRKKHVGERSVFPSVCMWANSVLWAIYGLCIGDIVPTVVTNFFGLVFSTYYCAVFAWAVESPSRQAETYNMFAGTFFVVCVVITFCSGSLSPSSGTWADDRVQNYSGLAASITTVVQYASPLAQIVKVVERRSTESISSVLATVALVCSSLWLLYGMVTDNAFIYVPNVLGLVFSVAQCCLFFVFPRKVKMATKNQDKGAV